MTAYLSPKLKCMKYTSRLLIILLVFIASCSPKGFMFNGKSAQQVKITDIGELFSTYNFSSEEKQQLNNQIKNADLVNEIITYAKEDAWPDAINTLDERLKVRPTMLKYNFYKVATAGTKTIVVVPADKNKHMPSGFVPKGPMYMVFASKAVISK